MEEFFEKVWEKIGKIPKGKVSTYGEIAASLNLPNHVRVVAKACNENPKPIKTPCHRVVHANGKIGGFKQGVGLKIALLHNEGVKTSNGMIQNFEQHLIEAKKLK